MTSAASVPRHCPESPPKTNRTESPDHDIAARRTVRSPRTAGPKAVSTDQRPCCVRARSNKRGGIARENLLEAVGLIRAEESTLSLVQVLPGMTSLQGACQHSPPRNR